MTAPSTPHPIATAAKQTEALILAAVSPAPSRAPSSVPSIEPDQADDVARALASLMQTCAHALVDAGFDTFDVDDVAEGILAQLGTSVG